MIFALAALDPKATLLKKWHTFLFGLVPAITPRMLCTVDEKGAPLSVDVRVGQAVDITAQAGRPKTITGIQQHTVRVARGGNALRIVLVPTNPPPPSPCLTTQTPVLLGANDRAELVDDTYIALSSILEGVVVLRPNPVAALKKKNEAEREEKKLKLGAPAVRARADLAWG